MSPATTCEIILLEMSVWQKHDRHVHGASVRPLKMARPRPESNAKRRVTMRFMVIVKASKDSEAGVMPSTELLTAMGKFNEEMLKAGVMEAGEGLHPSSNGVR